MAVVPFPKAPMRIRCARYVTVTAQLIGLKSDLIAAAAEMRDPLAAEELLSAAARLRHVIRRMEAGI